MSVRRAPLLVAVWVAGVALATGTGLLAVGLVADAVGDPAVPVLSAEDVRNATPSPQPSPTRGSVAPSRPGPSPARVFTSAGGTVAVRCSGSVPEQVYATPAQGWVLDETSREGSTLETRFESGRTRVRMTVGCSGGGPVLLDSRTDSRGPG